MLSLDGIQELLFVGGTDTRPYCFRLAMSVHLVRNAFISLTRHVLSYARGAKVTEELGLTGTDAKGPGKLRAQLPVAGQERGCFSGPGLQQGDTQDGMLLTYGIS